MMTWTASILQSVSSQAVLGIWHLPRVMVFGKLPCLSTAFKHLIEQLLGLLGAGLPVELVLESRAQLIIALLS